MVSTRVKVLGVAAAVLAVALPSLKRHFRGGMVSPDLLAQNLSGRTYIVTGGNTGIGYETAAQLAKQNATVVMACRDAGRCAAAATRIKASVPHPVDVRCEKLDLSDLSSVREFAARVDASYPRVDALVNNAGVMFPPLSFTRDGFELTFGTNHLGHVLLTDLLLDKLKASAPSRIINLSSRAHEFGQLDLKDLDFAKRGYGQGIVAYGTSKLANILHAQELARHLNGSGVTAVSVHPGTVRTELYRYLPFGQEMLEYVLAPVTHIITKNVWEGTQTSLHTLLDASIPASAGEYFADCEVTALGNPQGYDQQLAADLWRASRKMVGLSVD